MELVIEISISILLSLFVLIGFIRITLFKKQNGGLAVGLFSLISIVFGLYLRIKNGLVFDYGTKDEIIIASNFYLTNALGMINIILGFLFVLFSIVKFVLWKIKVFIK